MFDRPNFLPHAVNAAMEAGWLTAEGVTAANRVREIGQRAVHRDPAITEEDAKNAIMAARLTLKELYGIGLSSTSPNDQSGA